MGVWIGDEIEMAYQRPRTAQCEECGGFTDEGEARCGACDVVAEEWAAEDMRIKLRQGDV